ncbi:hypothetical protein Misp01_50070 [Microtetraspora sp. NBRC 13810]|uniref:hypothetical protein n=1 Tax=Microtetraspora sp. NBRC 13810 TaxID=3030990 RepID=UPI0024A396C2|nr:hypothetical protein [Microtetraspora sp. NBRC 13810]GLW09878.1 hypothetical protein Misp01_50070 [Microtetraspora sp. NBRC 13810]
MNVRRAVIALVTAATVLPVGIIAATSPAHAVTITDEIEPPLTPRDPWHTPQDPWHSPQDPWHSPLQLDPWHQPV